MSLRSSTWQRDPNHPQGPIGAPEHDILVQIGRFGYLSAEQVNTLLYSHGSIQGTRARLQKLFQQGYLNRRGLSKRMGKGAALALHSLDYPGYHYLRKLGLAPEGRFRVEPVEDFFLRHTLAANQLVVLSHALARHLPSVELCRFQSERELKQHPVYVNCGRERVGVVPDGWVEFRLSPADSEEGYQVPILWELDRATTQRLAFQRKIAALSSYIQGPYQEEFATETVTIAIAVAVGGQRRLSDTLSCTEATLTQLATQELAPWFLFSSFDPQQLDPMTLFAEPIWVSPFSQEPQSLLPQEVSHRG
jgi:hypothetical protein